jgi:hypothetical protein
LGICLHFTDIMSLFREHRKGLWRVRCYILASSIQLICPIYQHNKGIKIGFKIEIVEKLSQKSHSNMINVRWIYKIYRTKSENYSKISCITPSLMFRFRSIGVKNGSLFEKKNQTNNNTFYTLKQDIWLRRVATFNWF